MADKNNETKVHGVTAEFTSVDALLAACRRVRDAGYTKTDAFTPFPVHGIDTALGIKPTVLPWIALVAGLSGTAIAFAMQIWMNGIDYQYIISGKPYISTPAFIPVAFELTILLASFGTFFGMWALNGLPRFSNPVFTNPRFDRATDDTFFLYIGADDPKFDADGCRSLLADAGGEHVAEVVDDDSGTKIPKPIIIGWAASVAFSLIPLLVVAKMRVTNSPKPRFHIFTDMDLSPSKDAQQTTTLFADFRAARPDVPGTVARGELGVNLDNLTGIKMDELAAMDAPRAERLVAFVQGAEPAEVTDGASDAGDSTVDQTPWLTENPVEVNLEMLKRGQSQFNIYCAVCHGRNGRGNGLVTQRAAKILATTWTPPSNILDSSLHQESYPDGKLFSTITNGVRKMAGYAAQIKAEDRWAIVAYVRALQLSQSASMDEVPASKRKAVEEAVAEAEKKINEAAAAASEDEADEASESPAE